MNFMQTADNLIFKSTIIMNITKNYVIDAMDKNKKYLCENRQYIQELQYDNKDGDRVCTVEVFYTDDGYIYSIIFTNEMTGDTREFSGAEGDELAKELIENNLLPIL